MEGFKDFISEYRVAINVILIFAISYYTGALIGVVNSSGENNSPKDQDLP